MCLGTSRDVVYKLQCRPSETLYNIRPIMVNLEKKKETEVKPYILKKQFLLLKKQTTLNCRILE